MAGAGGQQRQRRAPARADHNDGVIGARAEGIDLEHRVFPDLSEEQPIVDGPLQGGARGDPTVGHPSERRT